LSFKNKEFIQFLLFGLTTPHPETQTFLARLQVLILRVVFLHCLKVTWQDCLQLMAASPVLVLAAMTLLGEAEAGAADEAGAAEVAATAPDDSGRDLDGVPD